MDQEHRRIGRYYPRTQAAIDTRTPAQRRTDRMLSEHTRRSLWAAFVDVVDRVRQMEARGVLPTSMELMALDVQLLALMHRIDSIDRAEVEEMIRDVFAELEKEQGPEGVPWPADREGGEYSNVERGRE